MTATTERTRLALLLEADPGARTDLARALEARGLAVAAASDGEEGVALLLDLLLGLDVLVVGSDLPGRSAASILHLVRVAGGEDDLPVVATGRGLSSGARAQLLALGADAVLDLGESGAESAGRAAAVLAGADREARPSAAAARRARLLPVPLPWLAPALAAVPA